ncbi:MAG: HAMP domain-containing histidine kinase [Campylobacterales bacterium]|nr:HAMP domain-containing histidine kinase [Campylobacterales bacterium]
MIRRSLFLKITLFFLIVFVVMGVGFYAVHQELEREHKHRLQSEAGKMLLLLRQSVPLPPPMRRSFLQRNGYSIVDPHPDLIRPLRDAFAVLPETYSEAVRESIEQGRIRILKDDRHLYVYLTQAAPPMLVVKADIARKPFWPEALFGTLLAALLLFYLLIIKTLFPLKTLIRTIERYGDEGKYLPIQSSRKDEIATISNALDEAMHKNQKLMEARRLFLRNIMHELKTPITAGKLALPFLKNGEEKSILERAFLRMQHLIAEVVRVEQITSGALSPTLKACRPKELADKAAKLLFLPPEAVEGIYDDTEIHADCDVFVSVFKNLIDNGLKYSPDHTVRIVQTGVRIVFSNRGEPWPRGCTFDSLCEPFHHPDADPNSFGLGLYIVKSVIDAHGFTMSYRYDSGEHHFELVCRSDPAAHG